ncbi:MAG: hypothetical protein ACE361_15325 [Aureliella sp.]
MKTNWLWLGIALVGWINAHTHAEEISDENYQELLKELTPDSKALWRQIPWKTSLLEAQKEAAANRKPIFIWAMDGHPLGCT